MNPRSEYGGRPDASSPRLSSLIGLPVRFANGQHAGYVNDVRFAPSDRVRGSLSELVTHGLVVGRHRRGTMLGYDRRREQGPLLVRVVVRAIQRDTGYVPWTSVRDVGPGDGVVQLSVDALDELEDV
ncbi:MAG TPA: hypothetical protein VFG63_15465 [Nocardioidaceae bacterium]|nr:hypothetical protein [Nocardioidaceae bacterium]